jgi:hypothetical protein
MLYSMLLRRYRIDPRSSQKDERRDDLGLATVMAHLTVMAMEF